MFWIARAGLRSAARNSGSQRPQQEFKPFTKLIWLVAVFAVAISAGGAWRTVALVILGLFVAGLVIMVACALGNSTGSTPQTKRTED
jgi:hypothetical protein